MATLVIVATIAVPLLGGLAEEMRSRGAADQIMGALRLARQLAISNGATYAANLSGHTISITCSANCPAHGQSPPAIAVADHTTLLPSVNPVRFDRLGGAQASAQVSVQVSGLAARLVCVSASGRIVRTAAGASCPP